MDNFSHQVWDLKYRLKHPDGTPIDRSVEDTWSRVALAAAEAESRHKREFWATTFRGALTDYRFLPAGRILAGAGSGRSVTLFNCFVMGNIPDDLSGIFAHLREAALTMQQGGGIGYDFSTLRPKGAMVKGVGADAWPVSFMDVWDLHVSHHYVGWGQTRSDDGDPVCSHPDIEEFIDAKRSADRLRNFNLSVLVTDAFMAAVENDLGWDLAFDGRDYRTVSARALWDRIMRATFDAAEPGVIFIDRVTRLNNLAYCESIQATNPCGEQPLPPYGACLLGSINLAKLVRGQFTEQAELDEAELSRLTGMAVRFLDNIIDVSRFPLPAQQQEAVQKRRIGLGITGLADALIFCRRAIARHDSIALIERWLRIFRDAAYQESADAGIREGRVPAVRSRCLSDADPIVAALPNRDSGENCTDMASAMHCDIDRARRHDFTVRRTISPAASSQSSRIPFAAMFCCPTERIAKKRSADFAYRDFRVMFGEDTAIPEYLCQRAELIAFRSSHGAGGRAKVHRQFNFQNDQLPGGHSLRRLQDRFISLHTGRAAKAAPPIDRMR